MANNFFGIDFGTTNTATVGHIYLANQLMEITYGDNGQPIPSVVAIDKQNGQVYTGREAWSKKMELAESCELVTSVKSLLEDENWQHEIHGELWTPVEVAAELFNSIRKLVQTRSKVNFNNAVVAIPIGFSPLKRQKLREAAKKAGINITSFISEPTAAFFANYEDLKSSTNIAVFDWGGGTLDVSILKNQNHRIYELATGGLPEAGDYIDNLLARHIHDIIAKKKGKIIAFDDMSPSAKDMIRVRAEQAKRAFGDDDDFVLSLNNYGNYGVCRLNLDYYWFAAVVRPIVDKAMEHFAQVLEESGVGLANIDRILMVGGSSNLRPLLDKMYEKYGDKIYQPNSTMWNVGKGAALLAKHPGVYRSNQSVGVILSDDSYFELLGKDEKLQGWEKMVNFGVVDTSEEARFVFAGSDDIKKLPDHNNVLSIPGYKFLQERIKLTARVTDDMVFEAQGQSNIHMTEKSKLWEYPSLKCYYEIP